MVLRLRGREQQRFLADMRTCCNKINFSCSICFILHVRTALQSSSLSKVDFLSSGEMTDSLRMR